jgi:hypothetical protein
MEGPCVQTDRGVLAPGMKADINRIARGAAGCTSVRLRPSWCDHPAVTTARLPAREPEGLPAGVRLVGAEVLATSGTTSRRPRPAGSRMWRCAPCLGLGRIIIS